MTGASLNVATRFVARSVNGRGLAAAARLFDHGARVHVALVLFRVLAGAGRADRLVVAPVAEAARAKGRAVVLVPGAQALVIDDGGLGAKIDDRSDQAGGRLNAKEHRPDERRGSRGSDQEGN